MASGRIRSRTTSVDDNVCSVCHDTMEILAIGRCDHPICYRCSTRMRILCEQMYCPICRADLQQVYFVKKRQKFQSIDSKSFCINRKFMIFSETEQIQWRYKDLLENQCTICRGDESYFRTFELLKHHMSRNHKLFSCDLCVLHLKLFSRDRKFYDREGLAIHKRIGDNDDKSYKGHPLCKFCDERYFDNDELVLHLRKDHYFCHFCEASGNTQEFYCQYNNLRDHFRDSHYLCEEGACANVEWSNAFRSDIDMRSHLSTEHSKAIGKSQVRQLRALDVDITFAPRENCNSGRREYNQDRQGRRDEHPRGRGNRDTEGSRRGAPNPRREQQEKQRLEIETAQALSYSLAEVHRQGHVSVIDPRLAENSRSLQATSDNQAVSSANVDFNKLPDDFPTIRENKVYGNGKINNGLQSAPAKAAENGAGNQGEHRNARPDNSSSQGCSDTLARKVAITGGHSIKNGSMDDSEFPSLSGFRKASPGGKNIPGGNKKTVWNGKSFQATSDQRVVNQTSKVKSVSRARADDFPVLGGGLRTNGEDFQAPTASARSSAAGFHQSSSTGDLARFEESRPVSAGTWVMKKGKNSDEVPDGGKENNHFLRVEVKNKGKKKKVPTATLR